jgi:hypothetical protein
MSNAILSAVTTVLLVGACIWTESMPGGLRSHAEKIYEGRDHRSRATFHDEIWFAQEVAVRRARLHLSAMIFAMLGGISAAITASYLIGRKDDAFVMLWDKVAALESQLDELKRSPPT